MIEKHDYWLKDAENTRFCGSTLAATLYGTTDIFLTGELGAGKTTFLDGFSSALGISESLPSPTYALEQRHKTSSEKEFIHCDLYRLSPKQAGELLSHTDDHDGIRCIEWSERIESLPTDGIHIHIEDPEEKGRTLQISFQDVAIPSNEDIRQWRNAAALPEHIIAHCNAVADFCDELSDTLIQQNHLIRKNTLRKAAELHDLFRFIDFTHGAAHNADHDAQEDPEVWKKWKEQFAGMRHEEACATFLQEKGYDALAEIVRVHGLQLPPLKRQTIEQKLLYYADKRMKVDKKVTLQERFEDFNKRYGNGEWSEHGKIWFEEAKRVEKELFRGSKESTLLSKYSK